MFANKQFRILVAFLTLTLCLGLLTVGVRAEEPDTEPVLPESASEKDTQSKIELIETEKADQDVELKPVLPESISEEESKKKLEALEAEKAGKESEETENSSTDHTSLEPTTTTQGAVTPPWSEDFSGFSFGTPPPGWSEAAGILGDPTSFSSASSSWASDGFSNNGTTGSARLNIYGTSIDEWMFSPPIDLGAGGAYELKFDLALTVYAGTGSATLGADDIFAVVISTDGGTTWSSTNVLQQWDSSTPISNGAGDHIVIDLSSYSGVIQLGFYGESTVSNADNDLFVDNVVVKEPAPDFSDSSKEAPTPVLLGDPITYTIAISNTGDLPANSATMTDVIPANTTYIADSVSCSSGTCSYNGGENMIEWDGSVAAGAEVEVSFAVESDDALPLCGISIANTATINDPDAPSVDVSANTELVFAAPILKEGFEGATFPPPGWASFRGENDLGTGFDWTQSTTAYAGASAAFVRYENVTGGLAQDWLVTPQITLGASPPPLSFWMRQAFSGAFGTTYTIRVSTNSQTTHADFTTVQTYTEADFNTTYENFTVDLSAYSGQSIYVAFVMEQDDGDSWYIDDVSIVQPCPSVTLEPETSSAFVCPIDPVAVYPLTVANNHDADTIDAMLSGNSWTSSVDPASLAMGANTTDTINVTVEMPANALPGDTDTVTVTAMAQTSGLSDIATIQTAAAGLGSGWDDLSTSGHGVRYHAVVHDNGNIYQIGGNDGGYYTGTHRYEIASDSWMMMSDMLTGTYHIDGAAIDGNIYVPGGQSSANSYNDFVQVYSTTGNSWSTVAPMPVPVRRHEVVALDGLLYVLGGQTTGLTYTDTVQIYDPSSDSWSLGAPMPTAVGYASSGVIDGKIYVAGGFDGSGQSDLQIYDPTTDSWSQGPPLPSVSTINGVESADGVLHDRFLILAGGSGTTSFASVYAWVYDAAWETWYRLPDANSLRYGAEGASDGSQFYYVAGREFDGGFFYSDRVERLINCGDGVADLEVTKTDEEDPAVTDQVLSYTLKVTNNGYWDASNVMLTDTLPVSTTYAGASPACSESGGVVTCALGDLDAFDSISVTIAVNTPSTGGTIVNQASVSADEVDSDPSNNSVSEETTITPLRIDLAKTVGLDSGVCADSDTLVLPEGTHDVTYCYDVTNTGLVTLTTHDLTDSELGTLLSSFPFTLTPGASIFVTQTATLSETTANTAVWTGYDVLSNTASAEATALVDLVLPSIEIAKTVGTEAGVCAEDSELLVVPGTEVHYCVEVTNTGAYTLSRHTLADSELGNIFTDLDFDLGPGESVTNIDAGFAMNATITTDTTNLATWTAYDELNNSDVATDTATVTVGSPSIELEKTVGTQPGVCADSTDLIYVAPGTDVYYCYTVSNTGDITLDTHSLTDSELGDLFTDIPFVLNPGAGAFIVFSDTISVDTVNEATWTASSGDIEATASDSATVLMTEPDALTCNGSTIEFEAGIPSDWMTANVGNVYWSTTDHLDACDNGGNQTNGSGEAACADADQTNSAADPYDAELWTNPFDLDASLITATLSFEAAYNNIDTGDFFDVDISNDGGATWDNLLSWNEDHFNPGEAVSLDLLAYAGESDLIVRYRYYGDGWDWYAQIDQVSLNCVEDPTAPEIDVTPTELASTQAADTEVDEMLSISNTGDAELTWDVTIDVAWASVDMTSGSTAAGASSDLTVTFDSTGVAVGTHNGTLSIASNDADEPTVDVALTLTVVEDPQAMVEVDIPAIMLKAGQSISQTLTISNTGEVDFNWGIGSEDTTGLHSAGACSGTLPAFPGTTLDPTSGMTPAGDSSDVTMTTNTADVEPGDYTGNVCVTITESGEVIAVPITMTVTEPTAVEMAELSAQATSPVSLGFVVAGMMFLIAGGYVVHRRRKA